MYSLNVNVHSHHFKHEIINKELLIFPEFASSQVTAKCLFSKTKFSKKILFQLSPGMCFFIHIFQFLNCSVRIHLGGSKAAMTKQFFYCIQVCPIIHKVSGKTVPEYMG